MSDEAYGGVLGAFPYALRRSESRLFRSYVVVGGLIAALVTVMFVLALIGQFAATSGAEGGVFTFVRTFFVVIGLLVVAPLIAPVLFVARRHRTAGSDPRYDAALAATGYAFVLALYLGLVISTPESDQQAVGGAFGPVVETLYSLPRVAGVIPPVLVAVAVFLVGRRYRP